MPDLPDLTVYLEALAQRLMGQRFERLELRNPFLLRSVTPTPQDLAGRPVVAVRRLGKRLVIGLEGDLWLVLHLMIAGRLAWAADSAAPRARNVLALLRFESGVLAITEAGSKRRAALHLVAGGEALAAHDPGGLEVLETSSAAFATRLRNRNHTLKRALTDPHLLAGIGNAYSDEILHAARLSPIALTQKLTDEEMLQLHSACRAVLVEWTTRLRETCGAAFPAKVTAFRAGMAVHGRYRLPCPVCGAPVQRIRYADHETNYCARCQTGGRLLADRALSRLLKQDWPRSLEELERGVSSQPI